MEIKKGQIVEISHSRKGRFSGISTSDVDTETNSVMTIVLLDDVEGLSSDWEKGESLTFRLDMVRILSVKDSNENNTTTIKG